MMDDAPNRQPPSTGLMSGCFGLAAIPLGLGLLFALWLSWLMIFG